MLSQERIKLMTKMAAYEENEGKKYMSIGSYFRSDYMGMQVIRSVISGTLAFFLLAGLYVYYHFETMMQDIYKMDLLLLGRRVLFVFIAAYSVITYVIYSFRYSRAKRSLKHYYYHLKQLAAIYDIEKGRH